MKNKDTFFWTEPICIRIDAPRTVRHFHKIVLTGYEESPAGTEGEIYTAKCGKTQTDFYYAMHGFAHTTGNLEKAIESGEIPCNNCFQPEDLVFKVSLKRRIEKIAELLKTFNSEVMGEDIKNAGNCPGCKSRLQINDMTENSGSGTFFTPLHYCLSCGYYRVEERQHTTDY